MRLICFQQHHTLMCSLRPVVLSSVLLDDKGFRLVAVGSERISHKWFPLASMPTAVSNVAVAAADGVWDGDGMVAKF